MNVVSNQETHDGSQAINRELNAKIIKMGYLWLCYGAVVTVIIMLMPETLAHTSIINNTKLFMMSKMPYVIRLTGFSATPESVIYSFSIVLLAAPVHGVFTIVTIIMSYMAGYKYYDNNKKKSIIFACLGFLTIYGIFFTCFGCNSQPDWRVYLMISNRFVTSFMGQMIAISLFLCIAIFILAVFVELKRVKLTDKSERQ